MTYFFGPTSLIQKKTWGPLCCETEIRVGIVGAKVGSFFSNFFQSMTDL